MSELFLLPDRAVIRIAGDDALAFLQGIVTQDLDKISAGGAGFSALLTPQGKILFDFLIVKNDHDFLIDCRREAAGDLVKKLTLYKLRAKVSIAIDESLGVYASSDAIDDPAAFVDPRDKTLGSRLIAAKSDAAEDADYHRRRIAAGVPEFGADFAADQMFLTDVNADALNGVSYEKGCFVGQEVTSRMKRKGEIRRRTLIAAFDGDAPPKGAAVTAEGSTLGEILGAAEGRALALIRLDRWDKAKTAGASIECAGRTLRLKLPAYLEQS